jgi:SpoVK/Ycf46/Vps4 family AAA+-type ATPase
LEVETEYKVFARWFLGKLPNAVTNGLGVLFMGPNGIGKTSMQCAFGKEAIVQGFKVQYFTAQQYLEALKAKNTELMAEYESAQVVLLDELDKVYVSRGSDFVKRTLEDFLRRTVAGDEDTLACVGLNFPRDLTPSYRGKLIELVLPWNRWALDLRQTGRAETVPEYLEMELYVLRLGDVAVVGMPCEPFQGIGRLIRRDSPLPLTIPCGYVNYSHGYITDGPNTGDREYTSAFYRYTLFRPPLEAPAGDVLAIRACEVLESFLEK